VVQRFEWLFAAIVGGNCRKRNGIGKSLTDPRIRGAGSVWRFCDSPATAHLV